MINKTILIAVLIMLYLSFLLLNPTPVETEQIIYREKIVEIPRIVEPQWLVYEITAYTAGYESTGKRPGHPQYGITASGERVQERWTIACPRWIPFGTKIFIKELDWTYSCQDRGSAITDGHLDIYIADLHEALKFGRQPMHIFILPRSENR